MAVNERRRKVRSESAAMDLLYIAVGIAVVLMAAASFLDPKGNMVFFPIIFFLAAVLNLTAGKSSAGANGTQGNGPERSSSWPLGLRWLS